MQTKAREMLPEQRRRAFGPSNLAGSTVRNNNRSLVAGSGNWSWKWKWESEILKVWLGKATLGIEGEAEPIKATNRPGPFPPDVESPVKVIRVDVHLIQQW
jgi:hypothetical protein